MSLRKSASSTAPFALALFRRAFVPPPSAAAHALLPHAAPPSALYSSHAHRSLALHDAQSFAANEEQARSFKPHSEWSIIPKKLSRDDGSIWPWHCFTPADSYTSDLSIDITKHYKAEQWVDKLAQHTVRLLRIPRDLIFQNRHVSHALLLETVAAVPGMVGGMLLHCKSLRKFEHSGGWIRMLLAEAENERMHLLTWIEVLKPNAFERALILAVQGGFFNSYFLLYALSPRLAHRVAGYLEEEAVQSYTEFLEAIDNNEIPNGLAPSIAIDYWKLPKDARLRDVVLAVRADEAHHRDVNHFAADIHAQGSELRLSPAPIDYH